MTVKEEIHRLVEELSEDQAELARQMLQDLCNADDANGPPLDSDTLASLDRGLADIAAGRMKSLQQYKHERKL